MSMKNINGKFYLYVEETGEYLDPVTREPVTISNEEKEPESKPSRKAGPSKET